jgi:ribosomal protein S18 acetylase RimI-like enzyme
MLGRHMEVQAVPKLGVDSWWQECSLGPVELIEFRLVEKSTSAILATATAWEMEGFSWRWGLPAVGLLSVVVQPERRKQGFAKYLMTCILHHLKDQFFGLVDVQAAPTDDAAIGLLQGLGFEAVDRGHLYQRTPTR